MTTDVPTYRVVPTTRRPSNCGSILRTFLSLLTMWGSLPATCNAELVGYDTFDARSNVISYIQDPPEGTFSSPSDGFQVYHSGVTPTPPQLLDESTLEPDSLGIVNTTVKQDKWFGVTDIRNSDFDRPAARADWQFDITGYEALSISLDIAAMGDFESSDQFDWFYRVDDQPFLPLISAQADTAIDHLYRLADGTTVLLPDPLAIGSEVIDNVFRTFQQTISETGTTLTLRFETTADGGQEALAFDNLMLEGTAVAPGVRCDLNADLAVDASDMSLLFANWGTGGAGDLTHDGMIDAIDAEICFSEWTGDPIPVTVPEPTGCVAGWLMLLAWLHRWTGRWAGRCG